MTMPIARKRLTALTAAFLAAALTLTACGGDSDDDSAGGSDGETHKVEADNGTIEVPADPQRIAVLGNAVVSYLDLGGEPIAVTNLGSSELSQLPSDQQAAYEAATNIGDGGEGDLEKLAALKPDLIVIAFPDFAYEEIKDKLDSIAPTVWLGFDSDWKFRAAALAEATNKMDAFNEQKEDYDDLVAQIQQDYGDALKNTQIVEAYRWDGQDPATFGINNSLCAEIARDEGIIDFAPATEEASVEQISSLSEYDLILYSGTSDGQPTEAMTPLLEANAWKALPAVQSGHAQPVYCPIGRSFGFMTQYLEGLERTLASSLPANE